MDTSAWRARFARQHGQAIDLGLIRMQACLTRLDDPHLSLTQGGRALVHVSGTNGKGGVIRALEQALINSGKSVQTYTSPYLWNFEENIRLNGQSIAAHPCADLFARLWEAAHDHPLTWFEADTLIALMAFAQNQADVSLIECGMGGRRDATAVVPAPTCAVLTNVAGDHSEFLGDDLQAVAHEKAAIAKGGPLYVPKGFAYDIDDIGAVNFVDCGADPSLDLANAVLAAHFPDARALNAAPMRIGRWYHTPDDPSILYDVGHNAHAAAFLAEKLRACRAPYRLDLGMLTRKDPRAFLTAFNDLDIFLHPVDLGDQGHRPADLIASARALNIRIWQGEPYQTRLITGSHQTVARALKPEAEH